MLYVIKIFTSLAGLRQASFMASSNVPGKKSGCISPYLLVNSSAKCIHPAVSSSTLSGTEITQNTDYQHNKQKNQNTLLQIVVLRNSNRGV